MPDEQPFNPICGAAPGGPPATLLGDDDLVLMAAKKAEKDKAVPRETAVEEGAS